MAGNKSKKTKSATLAPMTNKGYSQAGASYKKAALKGFTASSSSAIEDIDYNNYTLRQRSRLLYMSQPLATSAVRTNRTNVIGEGLQLKSKIDRELLGLSYDEAQAWQATTEREFLLWAQDKTACDATGMNDFFELQQLLLISWLMSGDAFAVIKYREPGTLNPYGMAVQVVEADRVSTPLSHKAIGVIYTEGENPTNGNKIHDGIEVDSSGRAVAFWICDHYPEQYTDLATPEWTRVEIRGAKTGLINAVQIMESERPDQYRGVPYLSQVIEPLLNLRRYTESELMAALVESYYTAWITTTADATEMPFNEALPGDEATGPIDTLPDPNDYRMGPGGTYVLNPGENVTFGDPKRPASGFPSFVRAIAEQTGAALELPADLLLKSFNSSYSASRGALLEAWKVFRMRRRWFANDFCQPVYESWLSEAVARGRVKAPGFFSDPAIRKAWTGAEWTGPSQGQLDPVKEVQAETLACAAGFSTHEQSTVRLNGGDFTRNVETLKKENAALYSVTPATTAPIDEEV